MPRITRGGKWDFMNYPNGRFSAQLKSNISNISTYLIVESIAVGVDMKIMMINVKA